MMFAMCLEFESWPVFYSGLIRLGFDRKPVTMEFVVDKVALEQGFLPFSTFPLTRRIRISLVIL